MVPCGVSRTATSPARAEASVARGAAGGGAAGAASRSAMRTSPGMAARPARRRGDWDLLPPIGQLRPEDQLGRESQGEKECHVGSSTGSVGGDRAYNHERDERAQREERARAA